LLEIDTFVLQQDSALAHRAREPVQLLQQELKEFIYPGLRSVQILARLTTKFGDWGKCVCTRYTSQLKQRLINTWSTIL